MTTNWMHSSRRARGAVGGLLAAVLLAGVSGPAFAEAITVKDERGPALQEPANQLLRGKLVYTKSRTAFVAHLERVTKKRTWVGASVYYPDDSTLKISTTYRNGKQVTRGTFTRPGGASVAVPVTAQWSPAKGRVKIVLDNSVADPKPFNKRAVLDLYTVTKGEMHGPSCGFTPSGKPKSCNDDYVSARLSR